MTATRGDAYKLAREAGGLPYCATKVSLLEEAVRIADSLQDIELGFQMRNTLMDAAEFSGRGDVSLVAFSWCLAQHDRFPGRFNTFDLIWKYKWTITTCIDFPQIPRERIEALLDDFGARCQSMGFSRFSLDQLRRTFYRQIGEREAARSAHADFRKRHRDALSDCAACVAHQDCRYYQFQRQWARSLQAAEPVLAARLRCAEQPHAILGKILLSELRLGRLEDAAAHHQQGYRLVRSGIQFVDSQADHLRYLVLIGDLNKARTLVERHLADALATVQPLDRFEFLLAAWLWAEGVLRAGTRTLKVRLPEGPPPADDRGSRDIEACRDWFLDQAREIATQFDRRNGTDSFQRQIDELPGLFRLAR